MGEGGAGRRPARRAEEAPEGAEGGEEGCCNEKGRTQKRLRPKRQAARKAKAEALGHLAAAACISAVYSGSTSQITRLRPLRLAA